MLIRFWVTNFRSFKEKTEFTMQATTDKRLLDNVIQIETKPKKLLKTTMIYGANSSGKTTLLDVMKLCREFVIKSVPEDTNKRLNHHPFAFDLETKDQPTSFDIEFISNGIRYEYGFTYDSKSILKEYLNYYPNGKRVFVFSRDEQTYTFGSNRKFQEEISKLVNCNTLYVSISPKFNHKITYSVKKWFLNEFNVLSNYNPSESIRNLVGKMDSDPEFKSMVLRAASIADFKIDDVVTGDKKFGFMNCMIKNNSLHENSLSEFWIIHNVQGQKVDVPLVNESSGIIHFLSLIGPVIDSLQNGKTLIIDELDSSFHPVLCNWLNSLYHNPGENKENAQLIFTAQNTEILDLGIVRRDQIVFALKNIDTNSSEIHRLIEYSIRNDRDIRKAYLNGSFGTNPFIEPNMLME